MLHLFVGALYQLERAPYRVADDKAITSVPQKLQLKLWSIVGAARDNAQWLSRREAAPTPATNHEGIRRGFSRSRTRS